MFGKKKNIRIRAMHYEGIENFIQNAGCEIEITEEEVVIKKIKPEVTVKLPVDRIIKCEYLSEYDFLTKYHNCTPENRKSNILKSFLVITYTSKSGETKNIIFWAVPPQSTKFIDLQYKFGKTEEKTIIL